MSDFLDKVEDWQTEAERKRRELFDALASGDVRDPFTLTVFGMTAAHFFLATAVSVGLAVGSSPLTRALNRTEDAA